MNSENRKAQKCARPMAILRAVERGINGIHIGLNGVIGWAAGNSLVDWQDRWGMENTLSMCTKRAAR